jgi:hypothetical protein
MAAKREPEHLTVGQCRQLAAAMLEEAASLPPGPRKDEVLKLAEGYRNLAEMKDAILRKVH